MRKTHIALLNYVRISSFNFLFHGLQFVYNHKYPYYTLAINLYFLSFLETRLFYLNIISLLSFPSFINKHLVTPGPDCYAYLNLISFNSLKKCVII